MELLFQKLPSLPTSIGLHLFFLSTLSNKLWFPVLFLTLFFGFYLSLPWGGLLVFLIWLLLVVSAPRLEGHLPWDQLTYFLDLNQDEVPDSLRREDLLPKILLQKTYLEKPSGRGSPRLLSREWGTLEEGEKSTVRVFFQRRVRKRPLLRGSLSCLFFGLSPSHIMLSFLQKMIGLLRESSLFMVTLLRDLRSRPLFHWKVFQDKGSLFLKILPGLPLLQKCIFTVWFLLGNALGILLLTAAFALASLIPFLRGLLPLMVIFAIYNGPLLDPYVSVNDLTFLFNLNCHSHPDRKPR